MDLRGAARRRRRAAAAPEVHAGLPRPARCLAGVRRGSRRVARPPADAARHIEPLTAQSGRRGAARPRGAHAAGDRAGVQPGLRRGLGRLPHDGAGGPAALGVVGRAPVARGVHDGRPRAQGPPGHDPGPPGRGQAPSGPSAARARGRPREPRVVRRPRGPDQRSARLRGLRGVARRGGRAGVGPPGRRLTTVALVGDEEPARADDRLAIAHLREGGRRDPALSPELPRCPLGDHRQRDRRQTSRIPPGSGRRQPDRGRLRLHPVPRHRRDTRGGRRGRRPECGAERRRPGGGDRARRGSGDRLVAVRAAAPRASRRRRVPAAGRGARNSRRRDPRRQPPGSHGGRAAGARRGRHLPRHRALRPARVRRPGRWRRVRDPRGAPVRAVPEQPQPDAPDPRREPEPVARAGRVELRLRPDAGLPRMRAPRLRAAPSSSWPRGTTAGRGTRRARARWRATARCRSPTPGTPRR